MTGAVDAMPAAYTALDVVCLVSDDVESFGLCLVEAQACERPVVAMDCGGVSEAFVAGCTGFLIRQGDEDGLLKAAERLILSEGLRRLMGKAGREWVRSEMTMDKMAEGYEHIFTEAALAGPRRPLPCMQRVVRDMQLM